MVGRDPRTPRVRESLHGHGPGRQAAPARYAWRGRPGGSAYRARPSLVRARPASARGHVPRSRRGQKAHTLPPARRAAAMERHGLLKLPPPARARSPAESPSVVVSLARRRSVTCRRRRGRASGPRSAAPAVSRRQPLPAAPSGLETVYGSPAASAGIPIIMTSHLRVSYWECAARAHFRRPGSRRRCLCSADAYSLWCWNGSRPIFATPP